MASANTPEPRTNEVGQTVLGVMTGGVSFNVVIVEPGELYETDAQRPGTSYRTHRRNETGEPLAVVYDDRYHDGFPSEGQLVSSIAVSRAAEMTSGWNMHGGVPTWNLDAAAMREIGNTMIRSLNLIPITLRQ